MLPSASRVARAENAGVLQCVARHAGEVCVGTNRVEQERMKRGAKFRGKRQGAPRLASIARSKEESVCGRGHKVVVSRIDLDGLHRSAEWAESLPLGMQGRERRNDNGESGNVTSESGDEHRRNRKMDAVWDALLQDFRSQLHHPISKSAEMRPSSRQAVAATGLGGVEKRNENLLAFHRDWSIRSNRDARTATGHRKRCLRPW